MDFKDYQKRYYRTNPNYLAVYLVNKMDFHSVLDLGCGSGNETIYFLKKGKEVIAVDKDLNEEYFYTRVKKEDNLVLNRCAFEDFDFPKVDAVLSTFSLSFCRPDKFDEVWNKIEKCLPHRGILAGNLFGEKDSFSQLENVNVFTKDEVLELLSNYEIVKFNEKEYDQEASGKHRHYYDFVAVNR